LTAACLVLIFHTNTYALPSLSVEYGQSCFLCHVDPAGGGPRNLFGSQFAARNELATWSESLEELENFNPQINDWLTLGADLRVLYTNYEGAPSDGFQLMQGAIHLSADLNSKFSMYISKDWNNDFQAAGIAHLFPFDGYIKAGKFMPNFGLRPDDHTIFIRDGLFGNPYYSETGMELGFHPTNFELALSFLNGSSGVVNDNRHFTVAARGAYRINLNKFNFMLGGSFYGDDYTDSEFDRKFYGPFYGIFFAPFTLIGEVDWAEFTPEATSLITSQMLYYELYRGAFLRLCYDFHDIDIDWKSGAETRYTAGVQWFPYGFLEVNLNLRINQYEPPVGDTEDELQFDGQIHFFF